MPGAHWKSRRGDATRTRLLEVAARCLQTRGIGAISIRATAEECSVSHSALQHHYRTQDAFARAVVRFWCADVTQRLERAIETVRGIAATVALCREWIALREVRSIIAEATRPEDLAAGHDVARSAASEALKGWVELTRRTLFRARARNELRAGVDPRHLALELHRSLWSLSWADGVYGEQVAGRCALEGVWDGLAGAVVDGRVLPDRDGFVAAGGMLVDEDDDGFIPSDGHGHSAVWFELLPRIDPQFHAFMRHARLGEIRTYLAPPPVLPEDVAAAEARARRHPEEVAEHGALPARYREAHASPAE